MGGKHSVNKTVVDDPEVDKFLRENLYSQLVGKCDVRSVSPSLYRQNVVNREQLVGISLKNEVNAANETFYAILESNPSINVLENVAKCFKNDTSNENNAKFGECIDSFLASLRSGTEKSDKGTPSKDMNNTSGSPLSVFLSDKDHMDVLKQHIIDEVPHKWKKIATALGLSYNKMEAIESENRKNHNRLLTVFGLWLRGSHGTGEKSRTLQTLHDALVDSDCRPEAENILKHFEGISKRKKIASQNPSSSAFLNSVFELRSHVYSRYKKFKLSERLKDIDYIRLAVISSNPSAKKKIKDQRKSLDHFHDCGPLAEFYWHSNVEDLLKAFSSNNRHFDILRNRLCFLSGQPGMGKTTLLRHFCQQVALSKEARNFPLVLFFPLRDEAVANATNLRSLLRYYATQDSLIHTDAIVKWLVETKGKEVLFIFDGADEAKNLVRESSNSILFKLLNREILAESSIILSSRPGVCPDLKHFPADFYEVQGFCTEAIESYVKEFFKEDPSTAEGMLSILKQRPDLMTGAYIPMNLYIFCSIFDPSASVFPNTITECYNFYATQLYARECSRDGKDQFIDSIFTYQSKEAVHLVASLGELAYKGLTSTPQSFIFQEKEICKIFPSFERKAVDSFFKGLLHIHAGTVAFTSTYTFNFSHATLQEFFAAHHLQRLPQDEQLSFWKEHIWDPSFAVMLRFYAGLTRLTCEGVIDYIIPLEADHNSIKKLPSQATGDDPRLLFLFHMLYEAQHDSMAKNVMKHLSNSLTFDDRLSPFDTMVVSYCLALCTHLESLNFSGRVTFTPNQLVDVLTSNTELQTLWECNIGQKLTLKDAKALFSPKSLLREVNLSTEASPEALSVLFSLKKLEKLKLDIGTSPYEAPDCVLLKDVVRSSSSLKELSVHSNLTRLFEYFSLNKSVEILSVTTTCKGEAVAPVLEMPLLKKLTLQNVDPLPVLQSLSSRDRVLDELIIRGESNWRNSVPKEKLSDVVAAVSKAKVSTIEIKLWKMTVDLVKAFCTGLAENRHVKKVSLKEIKLLGTSVGYHERKSSQKSPLFNVFERLSQSKSIEDFFIHSGVLPESTHQPDSRRSRRDVSSGIYQQREILENSFCSMVPKDLCYECSREDVVPVLNMPQLKRLTLQSIDPLPILHSLHTRDESLERLSIRDWPHLWRYTNLQRDSSTDHSIVLQKDLDHAIVTAVSKAKVKCIDIHIRLQEDCVSQFRNILSRALKENKHVKKVTVNGTQLPY